MESGERKSAGGQERTGEEGQSHTRKGIRRQVTDQRRPYGEQEPDS